MNWTNTLKTDGTTLTNDIEAPPPRRSGRCQTTAKDWGRGNATAQHGGCRGW